MFKKGTKGPSKGSLVLHLDFDKIDIESSKSKFQLEERGSSNGEKNFPPPDSDAFDDVEQEVVHHLMSDYSDAVKHVQDRIVNFRLSTSEVNANLIVDQLQIEVDNLLSDLRMKSKEISNKLFSFKSDAAEAKKEERAFKEQHKLERLPQVPESTILAWAIILTILLGESILNAQFYGIGSEQGFLGGFFIAVGLAGINVLIALMVGSKAVPLKNHIAKSKRALGFTLITILSLFNFAFNFFVGHYREAFTSETNMLISEAERGRAAISQMLEHPFVLYDWNSWVLVLIGVLCYMVAAYEGYSLDDPYPGYGAVRKKVESAKKKFSKLSNELHEDIRIIRSKATHHIENSLRRLQSTSRSLEDAKLNRQKLISAFENHVSHLNSVGNSLLKVYWKANSIARSEKAPVRFSKDWTLKEKDGGVEFAEVEIKSALNDIESAREKIGELKNDFFASIEEEEKKVPSLEELE